MAAFRFLSNQISSGFFRQLKKTEFVTTKHENDVSVLVTDYDSSLWACFHGDIENNDTINLQTMVNGTLIEYRSFVSKQEILKFIDQCETPMIVRIDIKNQPYVSYICDFDDIANVGKSLIPNVIEIARKRDFQKKALYSWETNFLYGIEKPISPKAFKNLAMQICQEEGLDVLLMQAKIQKKAIVGCCYTLAENVFIPAQSVVVVGDSKDGTLIHELAHAVVTKKYGPYGGESHGPIFVRTYIDMLSKYLISSIPKDQIIKSAECKLKVATDDELKSAEAKFKALIG